MNFTGFGRIAGLVGVVFLLGLSGCTEEMWNSALQGGPPVMLKNEIKTVRKPSGLALVFVYSNGAADGMELEVPIAADGTASAPFAHVLPDQSGDLWSGVTQKQCKDVLNWPAVDIATDNSEGSSTRPSRDGGEVVSFWQIPKDDFISQTTANRDVAMIAYRLQDGGAAPMPLMRREQYRVPKDLAPGEHVVIIPFVVHEPDPGQPTKVALAILATPVTAIVDGVAFVLSAPLMLLGAI
jgi:hypothetical protein